MNQFNMYKLSRKQWNPFVGCCFDCIYCETSYKAQAKRQLHLCKQCYDFAPHYHEDRLNVSIPKTSEGEFIFTCASGDISFCNTRYLNKILDRMRELPDRMFLLQSKNPKTFDRVNLPDNLIIGTTLETNKSDLALSVSKAPEPLKRYQDLMGVNHSKKMVTIEPIMEFDLDVMEQWVVDIHPIMVWMGYNSKPKPVLLEPSLDDFNYLHDALKENGITVITKTVRPSVFCEVMPGLLKRNNWTIMFDR